MIRGLRAQLRRERRAAAARQLVCVDAQAKAERARLREHSTRSFDREDMLLTEHIAELREPLRRNAREHFIHDKLDVLAATPSVLVRNFVRAKERRYIRDATTRVQLAHDAQHLQLVFGRKTVTRLRLDGRRARAQKP